MDLNPRFILIALFPLLEALFMLLPLWLTSSINLSIAPFENLNLSISECKLKGVQFATVFICPAEKEHPDLKCYDFMDKSGIAFDKSYILNAVFGSFIIFGNAQLLFLRRFLVQAVLDQN